MKRALLVAAAIALLAAPSAQAKCCALRTPPAPGDLAAGEAWDVRIEVVGQWRESLPLTLIAWSDSTRKLVSGQARPTGTRGIHLARVVFPAPGVWSYTVSFGGFAGSVYAPLRTVAVAPPRSAGFRQDAIVASALTGAALLLVGGAVGRRRRSHV